MSTHTYTLVKGEQRHTFTCGPHGLTVTYWWGEAWLVRMTMTARDALASWHHLRRAGYRPAPRDDYPEDPHESDLEHLSVSHLSYPT